MKATPIVEALRNLGTLRGRGTEAARGGGGGM